MAIRSCSTTRSLFLAAEEQALGHRAAAREWYGRAAETWPTAQSPLLALSQLALGAGDQGGAQRAMERILRLPADEPERSDPWTMYYVTAGRNAEALLAEMRAAVPALLEPKK